MKNFSSTHLESIKNQLDIVDLISQYLPLKKAGANYKGACLFHSEKTASFIVSPAKQIFHCFGCHEGGDIFGFLMKTEHLNFPEAVEKLAERAGINLEDKDPHQKAKPFENKEHLYQANRLAAWHYHQQLLKSPEAEKARAYLSDRGVEQKQIENFRLGYCGDQTKELLQLYESKNIPLEAACKVGILKEGHHGLYEAFRHRVIFPIFNSDQKAIGLGGRILPGDTSPAKYINSSESPIYDKSANLFGLQLAKEAIRKNKRVIVVEGYLDVLTLHQFGFQESVAPLGTALTSRQVNLIKRHSEEIILLFDGDTAGWKAAERSLGLCLDQGLSPKVVLLPEGEDPDSFLRKQGAEAFQARLRDLKNLLRVVIDKTLFKVGSNSPEGKARALKELGPYLQKLKSSIERNLHIQYLSEKWALPQDWIFEELGLKKISVVKAIKGSQLLSSKISVEQTFFEIYLNFVTLRNSLKRLIQVECFEEGLYRQLADFLWKDATLDNLSADQLLERCSDENLKKLIQGLSVLQSEQVADTASQVALDCIYKMKKSRLKEKLTFISQQIQEAELNQHFEDLPNLVNNKQLILKAIDDIKA
ncbi:MAG: DNA primase [Deltaproteobacteria bacterium]|nr:DNA primase [Deltaproteobacteria bacterium]